MTTDTFKSNFGTRVQDSATPIITNTGNKQILKELRLTNTSANDVNVWVWVAINDAAAVRVVAEDDQYQIMKFSLPASDTLYVGLNDTLLAVNDTIQIKAATTDVVNAVVSYIEEV